MQKVCKRLLGVIAVFTMAVNLVQAQQDNTVKRLAVVEFSTNITNDKTKSDAITVRSLVESRMVATGNFQIVSREEIDKLLVNQQIQASEISSTENVKKLRLENISYIVTGDLNAMGNDYAITIKILDVSTGEFSHSADDFMGSGSRDLYTGITNLAGRFAAGITSSKGQVVQVQQSSDGQTTSPAAQTASRILTDDLEAVFGVKGVSAVFNAIHAFLQTCNSGSAAGRRERIAARIMLGDWIDLPHLTVQGDAGGGAINTDNIDLSGKGKLLRLIVVGIDSFATTNKDAPAHIVFQFQNLPVMRRMNPSDTNAGGYKASELRQYLTSSFLRGLLAAGVPQGALYAPTRYIANAGQGATAADALADWLWLPTERELFENGTSYYADSQYGPYSVRAYETAANQARLEYYDSNSRRIKYNRDGMNPWWWEASPSAAFASSFCGCGYRGTTSYMTASSLGGVAPAFCVR